MGAKLTALGVRIALLVLVLVIVASAGSPAAPPTADDRAGATGGAGDRADAVARLKNAQGDFLGLVRFRYEGDEVEVEADVENVDVNPGEFHGFHVHTTGICDPNSVDPATGSPFFSAGGHFNPTGESHGEHAGDFPVLLVQSDGHAEEEFDTDRFRLRQLFDRDGSAVIVHEGRDNYANIPERYHSHTEDVFGPDSATRATGDAGARFACGVVRRT
jgi:superoxide dismutase, Cu-Zn family